jgi:hypothetical protein
MNTSTDSYGNERLLSQAGLAGTGNMSKRSPVSANYKSPFLWPFVAF